MGLARLCTDLFLAPGENRKGGAAGETLNITIGAPTAYARTHLNSKRNVLTGRNFR